MPAPQLERSARDDSDAPSVWSNVDKAVAWCSAGNFDQYTESDVLKLDKYDGWRAFLSVDECKNLCIDLGDCHSFYYTRNGACFPSKTACVGSKGPGYSSFRSVKLSGGNDGGATNLQRCTGECDEDGQCASGLQCYQRDNGEAIPGCTENDGASAEWDYCYWPDTWADGIYTLLSRVSDFRVEEGKVHIYVYFIITKL